jgi:hypothetical protein
MSIRVGAAIVARAGLFGTVAADRRQQRQLLERPLEVGDG